MTGRHASKIGYEFTPADATASWILGSLMGNGKLHGVYHADHASSLNVSQMVLPRSEILLPEVLQTNGYHTVQVGKWHLGSDAGYHPINRGFDESLGFDIIASYLPYGDKEAVGCHFTDFFDRYLWANSRYEVKKDEGPSFQPKGYLTDYLSNQASDAITHLSSLNQSYFVYLAYTSMHTPLTAMKADYEAVVNLERQRVKEFAKNGSPSPPKPLSHCERVYAAMLIAMDRGVGNVLRAIDNSPQRDNTLVLFTNDNGAPNIFPELNKPYRGSKATFFEGGIRVPMLMRYPKGIKTKAGGVASEEIVSHIDIFDTLTSAAGIITPNDNSHPERDGVNLLPYLTQETDPATPLPAPHDVLFWRSGHYMALRNDRYKLQLQMDPVTNQTRYWLYDLQEDAYEHHNLMGFLAAGDAGGVGKNKIDRKVFDEMLELIQRENAIHPFPLWPSLSETPLLIDKIFYDKYEEGDEYIYWPN
jgi:arylsulfatase A-like enzyme